MRHRQGRLAFSQEWLLTVSLALIALYWVKSFWPFCALIYAQSFFYMALISVTNSISLRRLKDAA